MRVEFEADPASQGNTAATIRRLRQDSAMMFWQFNLFPHLAVLDHCLLGPMHSISHPTHPRTKRFLTQVVVKT